MSNLMNFLITPAYADAAAPAAAAGGSPLSLTLMFAVFFLFFYFAMWRPQSKRAREHRDLLGSLVKGDEVITSGGLLGRIHKITEQYVALMVHNNIEIVVQKAAIVGALPKGTLKTLE
jgi:preprotein translocase subunit YajC